MQNKFLFKLTKRLFLTGIIWFLGHSIYIIYDGLLDKKQKADCCVILGTTVNKDGTLSKRLEKRLECGLNLYKNGRVEKIIVSGGLGKEGFFEATKMKEFLVSKNVTENSIIVDNSGNNTLASVENTLRISDSLGFKNAIAVSQYFHLSRTKMLFRKRGFENIESASPNYFEIRDFYSVVREFFAFYWELLFD
jgi:vancomycin permeability regulator SanA